MIELPLRGRVLLTGPSNVGKTRLTARALERWIDARGAEGVVVLDFAPEIERDGILLGGRLSRFVDLPAAAWVGTLDAHAPRAEGETPAEASRLARENAERAMALIEETPAMEAAFVNDATIPLQHEAGDVEALLSVCADAELVVMNAFSGEELGTDDPISRREREVRERLIEWVDTHETLR